MSFVKSEFFPPSTRPELIAEMTLPRGASIKATAEQAQRMSDYLKDDPDIVNYSYYVGEGSPRFVLTLEPVLPMVQIQLILVFVAIFNIKLTLGKEITIIYLY